MSLNPIITPLLTVRFEETTSENSTIASQKSPKD